MFASNWMTGVALIFGIGAIAVALKMIASFLINKDSGPGGLPPGSTE